MIGCAAAKKKEDSGSSTAASLVYSPTTQIAADREKSQAAASSADRLRPGVRCRIHLRRDAIGVAGQSPLTIVGASMLSERASLVGTIDRVDPIALVIRTETSTYWVPRDVILAVEFPDERRP